MQVKIGDFVDKWLTEIRDARAEALRQTKGSDDALYWDKHVQDLLDQLSKELVVYIEHPPGFEQNEKARITVRDGKLIVSLDGSDYNMSSEKTRRGRLSFVMAKILKDKGSSRLYDSVSDLLKPPRLSPQPDRLATGANTVNFNTKNLPDAQEGDEVRYFYDPKNVGNDLNLTKVYKTKVNLEDIDQYRNADHRFGKTMSRFMNPDYRTLNASLRPRMSEENKKKGRNLAAKWVKNQKAKINKGAGVNNAQVVQVLNKNGLVAPSVAAINRIANTVNQQSGANAATAVATNATTANGGAPPPEAVAAVTTQLTNLKATQNSNKGQKPENVKANLAGAQLALAGNGLQPTNTNGLAQVANAANKGTNTLKNAIRTNTVSTNTNRPPNGQQVTAAADDVQALAGNQVAKLNNRGQGLENVKANLAGAQLALAGNGLQPTTPNGLAQVANAANKGPNTLKNTIKTNTVSTNTNRPPDGQQLTAAANDVQMLAGNGKGTPWKTPDPGPMPDYAVYPGSRRSNSNMTVTEVGMGAWNKKK